MKKVILMMAFTIGMAGTYARKTVKVEKTGNDTEETADSEETGTTPLPDRGDAGRSPSTGDLSDGLTCPVTLGRMVPPYALEMTFNKTIHLIFPAAIRYMDLGSADILTGKVDGSGNVFRARAALKDFFRETNLAVIMNDGSYYVFSVKYVDESAKPNIEMKDFVHDGEAVNRPNNSQEIYLTELDSESPLLIRLIMKSAYDNNRRLAKHIGCKCPGIQYILRGVYTHNGLLYLHTELKDVSNVPFSVDFITFKVMDRKVAERTAIQKQVIVPLRTFSYVTAVDGKSKGRTVFTLPKFTLPGDKQLVIEMNEQNEGRCQRFVLTNAELIHARVINELRMK